MLASGLIFMLGYFCITLEHKLKTHKSAIALFIASVLWIMAAFSGIPHEIVIEKLHHTGGEIFGLIVFLLAAMTIVETLIHFRFFDIVRSKIAAIGLADRGQFLLISTLTFFFSALLDNLTVTIIMIQIARRFFSSERLFAVVVGIVIVANAGGAWSPIGDVTTIMLWLAGKFSAIQIITEWFLPSLAMWITSTLMIAQRLSKKSWGGEKVETVTLSWQEKIIITVAFGSFVLPIIMNIVHLPPYLGLLLGLGIMWLLIEYFKHWTTGFSDNQETSLEKLLQKTDLSSIKFFIGILLAVGALEATGLLELLSHSLFGSAPSDIRIIAGSVLMGLVSAVVDNVPLTALAIVIIHVTNPQLWVLTALTVGTGGSLLLIGSVSGVVASGMVPELTFGKYFQIASLPVLLGYFIGVGVWAIQYYFLF